MKHIAPTFDEVKHKYSKDNIDYISATTLIHKFQPKKDWNKIAEKYALKNGFTADYWLKQWNKIKDEACEKGTNFHLDKEEEVSKSKGKIHNRDFINNVINRDNILELEKGVYTELRLWNDDYRVAGTSDLVYILDDRHFDIDDYKTNKKIDRNSYQDKFTGRYEMMLYPLDHLQNCNYVHYNLQISLYAYMLKCFGYTPRNLSITHCVNDVETKYKFNYLEKEVIDMLNYYKYKV